MQTVPKQNKLTQEHPHPPGWKWPDSGGYDLESSKSGDNVLNPFKDFNHRGINKPDTDFSLTSTRGKKKGIVISVSLLLLTVIAIACKFFSRRFA